MQVTVDIPDGLSIEQVQDIIQKIASEFKVQIVLKNVTNGTGQDEIKIPNDMTKKIIEEARAKKHVEDFSIDELTDENKAA